MIFVIFKITGFLTALNNKFMKVFSILIVSVLLSSTCSAQVYQSVKVDNPVYKPNTAFRSFEDLNSPGFARLEGKIQAGYFVPWGDG